MKLSWCVFYVEDAKLKNVKLNLAPVLEFEGVLFQASPNTYLSVL